MTSAFPIVIHHNPDCGTSRNTLEFIRLAGYEPTVIDYLQTGWTEGYIRSLLAGANLTLRQALRETKSPAAELGLLDEGVTEQDLMRAMLAHPVLVNRPFVITPKGVRLCRPSEAVFSLLDQLPSGPIAKEDGSLIIDEHGQLVA